MTNIDTHSHRPPARRWRNDPRIRAILFQGLALALVVWLGWTLFNNTLDNMQARGIRTGFGFLENQAGFGVLFSLIPYNESMSYFRVFLVGLLNTVLVSAIGIVLATILGFIIGIARLSSNWLVSKIALAYIEIFRNIPLLLQIFFWYFAVIRSLPGTRNSINMLDLIYLNNRGVYLPAPQTEPGFGFVTLAFALAIAASLGWAAYVRRRQERTGRRLPVFWINTALIIGLPILVFLLLGMPLHWSIPALRGFNYSGGLNFIPELGALLLALTMFTAAFIAEIVRSGIESVNKGQREAASALGLRPSRSLRLVIIPQALRVIIPQLTTQYLDLFKNSSLATAIGYPDLVAVFMGTTLNQTGRAVEIVAITMGVYLTISLLISLSMNLYNQGVALRGGRS
ncbi:amino acid ABC transporter permease [Castellaniella sp.]|uniref:amino acid ABC transporter permease n=1 Tax=Castellaniella sp. TaxID=1955812 RepID=UPI002AFF6A60|nr:amino acid ABC transporter permease [Castellaniella sp.]